MGFRRAAVVMAGGSGTRFWPVSTVQRPKQFLRLASPDKSLLAQSVSRAEGLFGDDVFVATSGDLVAATMAETGFGAERVFGEPMRRNTLGALVWATAHVVNRLGTTEASLAVLTADHMISPAEGFARTVSRAMDVAESREALVTIGIPPDRAATEYGYIEKGEALDGAWVARRFREKPDAESAREFVSSGEFLWNSGMFFWTVPAFLAALSDANPSASEVYESVLRALAAKDAEGASSAFASLENISIDYALMERTRDVCVVAADFAWDDLGSWDALSRSLPQDGAGNVSVGNCRLEDSRGSIVYNDDPSVRVSVLGVEGVVVVVSGSEVLVCPKDRAQDVRRLADD